MPTFFIIDRCFLVDLHFLSDLDLVVDSGTVSFSIPVLDVLFREVSTCRRVSHHNILRINEAIHIH